MFASACGPGEAGQGPHLPDGTRLASTRGGASEGAPLTRRAALHYDIRGRPFPLPVVAGRISGHPVLMLVDTGANSHVVAAWFARKVGVSMKKLGDIGT